jgi:hypothetical protein
MRNIVGLAAAALIVAIAATPSCAGAVWRACDSNYCTLEFEGEIGAGDAARLDAAVRSAPHVVQVVEFNSPGGDPFEALAMADLLNEDFIMAMTASCGRDGCMGIPGGRFHGRSSCASACALLFLAANDRAGNEVFLHRPTFPPAVFAALSGPNAQSAYDGAVDRLLAALRRRRVPEPELQVMMNMPSDGLQKLDAGYPRRSPWMAEWLIARCPRSAEIADPKGLVNGIMTHVVCETNAIEREQRRAQRKPG